MIKGNKHTKESKDKISRGMKNGGQGFRKTTFKKGQATRKGMRHTLESIEKMRISKLGVVPWNKGRRGVQEGVKGSKNNNWKGGISRLPYPHIFGRSSFKDKIKQRDIWTCQLCSTQEKLCIHHIVVLLQSLHS